ncbi:MAG: metal-sulfur cluster assembly factor [Verrucomicrobiota bacterium JB022]|nr:metal-sulfur cluster assembly factor [Verrucomicrobiota bacterium JB022]
MNVLDSTTPTVAGVIEALRTIEDPEVGLNIVDLGLIEEIRLPGEGAVEVDLIVTSPGCPLKDTLEEGTRSVVAGLPGVRHAAVRVRDDIRWTPDRISDPALLE